MFSKYKALRAVCIKKLKEAEEIVYEYSLKLRPNQTEDIIAINRSRKYIITIQTLCFFDDKKAECEVEYDANEKAFILDTFDAEHLNLQNNQPVDILIKSIETKDNWIAKNLTSLVAVVGLFINIGGLVLAISQLEALKENYIRSLAPAMTVKTYIEEDDDFVFASLSNQGNGVAIVSEFKLLRYLKDEDGNIYGHREIGRRDIQEELGKKHFKVRGNEIILNNKPVIVPLKAGGELFFISISLRDIEDLSDDKVEELRVKMRSIMSNIGGVACYRSLYEKTNITQNNFNFQKYTNPEEEYQCNNNPSYLNVN